MKKEDDAVAIKGMSPPPVGLEAVFEDGDGGYEVFPVLMFVVFAGGKGESDIIAGLISSADGLTVPDHDDDFIGYRLPSQKLEEFLADHGRDGDDGESDDDVDEEED